MLGDRFLVRNVELKGVNKIADKWTEEVYVVCDQLNEDIPVYHVEPETGQGKIRILDWNLAVTSFVFTNVNAGVRCLEGLGKLVTRLVIFQGKYQVMMWKFGQKGVWI